MNAIWNGRQSWGKRIGRVKGCGNLKSYPDELIDAIIFGRELGGEGDEYVTEERFDKIRYYLKTGTYPNGSDRAEKSRLRSAATHYRLVPGETGDDADDKLMLKGKEVIGDPHRQYEIARQMHSETHGGINKTTASIAEKYHWVRIKETVSAAIRNCSECKDPSPKTPQSYNRERRTPTTKNNDQAIPSGSRNAQADGTQQVVAGADPVAPSSQYSQSVQQQQNTAPMANMQQYHDDYDMPVDPQIMQSMQQWHRQEQRLGDDGGRTESMAMDGVEHHAYSSGQAQDKLNDSTADDEVDARLREELEAQINQG